MSSDSIVVQPLAITQQIVTPELQSLIITNQSGPQGLNFYSDHGIPSNSFGADRETYLNVDTGFLYKKISGIWVYQFNIIGPTGLSNFQTEVIVLNSSQISAKQVTLLSTPAAASKTTVEIQNAPTQAYGIDFVVIGNTINWAGLSFELLLEFGSILTIRYYN